MNNKLITLRERLHLSPKEVAALSGISVSNYYDLQSYIDETQSAVPLNQIEQLCKVLNCTIRSFLAHDEPIQAGTDHFDYAHIAQQISEHIATKKIPLSDFENLCGWKLHDALNNPHNAAQWNADCIFHVSRHLGMHWHQFLTA